MKKIKLLLAAMAAMVGMTAQAITIDTDLTSKFSSLATTKWQGSSGQVGWAAPQVTTNNGLTVAAWERYNESCDWTGDIMYTTVTGLDKGTYRIELYGAAAFTFGRGFGSTAFTGSFTVDSNSAYNENDAITENTGVTLYATTSEGTVEHEIPIYYATNFNSSGIATAVLEGVEVGDNGQIQIGLSKTSTSTNWHVVQLKGVTATVDADAALAAKVEEVESFDQTALTDEDAQALQAVINTYKGQTYTTADEYLAAIAALDQAVKDARAAIERAEALSIAKPKLDAMKAFIDATNFYTTNAYNEYYGQWAAKYEAGTLTLAEANALQNPTVVTGWHDAITVDNFLLSVWDAEPDFASNYYINSWSTEGENDGSNFKVPFFEYWTGDDNSLGARVLTATMTGMEADADYAVEIWARVRQTNNQTKTDGSITLQVGEGKTVDMTAGTQIGSSQFYMGTFTAYGKADSEGVLTVKINVAEGSNISWLSFKNAMYSKIDINTLENEFAETLAAAKAAKSDAANANVTGSELTALNDAITATPEQTIEGYIAAIATLTAATSTFTAAAPAYDKYVAYKAETVALWGSDLDVAAPTTAAEATVAVQNLNIAQYNKIADEYTFSASGLIGDFGSWDGTATVAGEAAEPNYLDWEHWSGETHAYYEQAASGWGNENGWTIQYQKICTLPAGDYVIKVAARSSNGVTSKVTCSALPDVEISLPCAGNNTRGINTSGVASWNADDIFISTGGKNATVGGTGAGWQWRFLPFSLSEQTEVIMTFYAEASTEHQWMSIADGELLSTTKLAQDVAYNETAENTISNTIIADVTIARTIKEGYNTMALPFTLTANQVADQFGAGTEVYAFSDASGDNPEDATINFTKGDGSITANVPVLVKATSASTSQTFNGVQIVANDAKVEGKFFDFVGVYAPTDVKEDDWFIGNGALYESKGNTSIKAFRAYLDLKAPVENVKMFIDGLATRISEIKGTVENGAIYNLAGQRVNNAQKGIFIVNGKKVVK